MRPFSLKFFSHFLRSTITGTNLLAFCLVSSLLIANSPAGESFARLLALEFGFSNDSIHLRYPLLLWVNDGLMAIFFLMVGLELKRELLEGELSSFKQAVLPILAAAGGAIMPALIYTAFNSGTATSSGWAIPMATDIAFALAAISVLGRKIPASLKIFIAALAIVDDLMAILVIALFYTGDLQVANLLFAAGVFFLLVIFNRSGRKHLAFYLIPGVFLWYFIHHSGIHATIAGVLVAMTIPANKGTETSSLVKLEHALIKPVTLFIVPLFALVNTNIRFEPSMIEGLGSGLGLGVILGLYIGKPTGIFLTTWLAVKLGLCVLPKHAGWIHILGTGLLAGIGFTMSIFIALLSFDDPLLQAEAKFSILAGSLLAGISGYLLLRVVAKKSEK